jgi:hypothetical protein
MSAGKKGKDDNGGVTEYHVLYVEKPYPRWEVQFGGRRMGYKAWDKRVATSAAREMAKANRPSKVIIHDRKTGAAESEVAYASSAPKRSKGIKRKLD